MKYPEFKNIYRQNQKVSFSKFQETLFQIQALLDNMYDDYLYSMFITLIETQDLNNLKTKNSAINIYECLVMKSENNFYLAAA